MYLKVKLNITLQIDPEEYPVPADENVAEEIEDGQTGAELQEDPGAFGQWRTQDAQEGEAASSAEAPAGPFDGASIVPFTRPSTERIGTDGSAIPIATCMRSCSICPLATR